MKNTLCRERSSVFLQVWWIFNENFGTCKIVLQFPQWFFTTLKDSQLVVRLCGRSQDKANCSNFKNFKHFQTILLFEFLKFQIMPQAKFISSAKASQKFRKMWTTKVVRNYDLYTLDRNIAASDYTIDRMLEVLWLHIGLILLRLVEIYFNSNLLQLEWLPNNPEGHQMWILIIYEWCQWDRKLKPIVIND